MTTTEKTLIAVCLLTIPGVLLLGRSVSHVQHTPPYPELGIDEFPSTNLLFALRTVESSLRPDAVSPRGARGLYQIMPETWQDHSSEPFSEAFNPEISRTVAITYLIWIRRTLSSWQQEEEDSIPLDHILSCWHGGIGRFRQRGYSPGRMPYSTREFVRRVEEVINETPH